MGSTTNHRNKHKIGMNNKQVYKVRNVIETLTIVGTAVGVLGTVGWKAYAEDKIDQQISEKLKPIEVKVDSNIKDIKHLKYESRQQLYLLKKIAGKEAVKEMEEETEIFKPED